MLERSGEYSRCLALPQVTWVRVGLDTRNQQLVLKGLTMEDLRYLEERARQLHREGHVSFLEQYDAGAMEEIFWKQIFHVRRWEK